MELENVQEIMPVSITSSDWKKSRTIVLLLSKFTQTDRGWFLLNFRDLGTIFTKLMYTG